MEIIQLGREGRRPGSRVFRGERGREQSKGGREGAQRTRALTEGGGAADAGQAEEVTGFVRVVLVTFVLSVKQGVKLAERDKVLKA